MSEPPNEFPALLRVYVVDTSAVLEIKSQVPLAAQWHLFHGLSVLLQRGAIAFPVQVRSEIVRAKYPDGPGVWIAAHKGTERHPQPEDDVLAEVLAAAPKLVDPFAEDEDADPYVVAMALTISRRLPTAAVRVATRDTVDRLPIKTSLKSACDRLGVECCSPEEFLEWARAEIDWLLALGA